MRIRYRNNSYSIRQMLREIIPAVIIMAAVVFMTACAGNGNRNAAEAEKGITAGVSDSAENTDSSENTSATGSDTATTTPGNEKNDDPAASQDSSANDSDASADNT